MYCLRSIVLVAICTCSVMDLLIVQAGDSARSSPVVIQASFNSRLINKDIKDSADHNISIVGDEFVIDGQPLRIVSGSLHYFRLPAAYWRDRLQKLKAAGLNAVSTYVEWSYHEPEEREYSFEGDRDVAKFVRMAAEEGLHVLLRPGPYICAERDLGGLPYWLLGKYPQIRLRSTDKDFIDETEIWMDKLFEQLSPLLFGNGGPIILVQVENEYGSYGSDKAYKEQVRDIFVKHVGTNALLYTTDGFDKNMIEDGAVSGTLTTIDFGVGQDVKNVFRSLRRYMPQGPLMNSEFYPGWLTHWGEKQQVVATDAVVQSLRNMLNNNVNVNFYVFFGGTNFEFSAGANKMSNYQPDITSYDYDAPLSEAGDPTAKYYAIRDALIKYDLNLNNIPPPIPSPKGDYGKVTVSRQINLLSPEGRLSFGKKYSDVTSSVLPTFEQLRQRAGLMMYETTLNDINGILSISKPRDWVYVYVDGEMQGVISRMHKKFSLTLQTKPGSVLSLLVENQGRINYGQGLHDYKGILSVVKYNNKPLSGTWTITGYPLEVVNTTDAPPDQHCPKHGPVFYNGYFTLPEGQAFDTFLDPTGWGRGYIWINGNNLGRYWPSLGPQVTLYVPGVWLQPAPAQNRLQILELEKMPDELSVEFITYPILNRTEGYIWINGNNFGRYLPSPRPQVTLYVPGVWLQSAPAQNRLQNLELEKMPDELNCGFVGGRSVEFINKIILY